MRRHGAVRTRSSAVAVAANAFLNLVNHGRKGTVKWRCAAVFTLAGVLGAIRGDVEALKNLPVPLHPGAARYYQEAGVPIE